MKQDEGNKMKNCALSGSLCPGQTTPSVPAPITYIGGCRVANYNFESTALSIDHAQWI